MYWFLSRGWLCERLRLKRRQSFRILSSGRNGLISTADVVRLLNRTRRGIEQPFTFVPCDIVTAQELADSPELAHSGLTAKRILAWTKRKRNVCPHFRINSHTRRFPRGLFLGWLDGGRR